MKRRINLSGYGGGGYQADRNFDRHKQDRGARFVVADAAR
jgi:hypothetical protein